MVAETEVKKRPSMAKLTQSRRSKEEQKESGGGFRSNSDESNNLPP